MRIQFVLCWGTRKLEKQFQLPGCRELFLEYTNRLGKFIPTDVKVTTLEGFLAQPGDQVWCCHGHESAMLLSSAGLAKKIETSLGASVKNLNVLIGPPDGFSSQFIEQNRALSWSFGPLTFPHELAAVVASEQIYRAFTILRGHPYHLGHL